MGGSLVSYIGIEIGYYYGMLDGNEYGKINESELI